VADTGPGLDPTRIPGLFAPFVQADTTITRTHGGSGLGLTISREMARAMGGDIEVESQPGAGATFRVTWP
jgi:signal transduction histidine kinase